MNTPRIATFVFIFLLAISVFAAKKPKKMEKPKPVGEKPNVQRFEPRGIQRGAEIKIHLFGTNLVGVTEVKTSNKKLKVEIDEDIEEKPTEAWLKVKADADTPRGAYEFWLVNEKGDSSKV